MTYMATPERKNPRGHESYNCDRPFLTVHSKIHICLFPFYSSRSFENLCYIGGNTFGIIYFIFTILDKNKIKFVHIVIIRNRKICMSIKQKIYIQHNIHV